LAETHKTQNEKLDLVAAVHKVQSYNLFIQAGMIVGFDSDDAAIFDEQFAFLQEANIPIVMPSVLLAVPRTPLYARLEAARRFFWRTLGAALRQSPRSFRQVIMMMGMYKHFCEVHAQATPWDPWARTDDALPCGPAELVA